MPTGRDIMQAAAILLQDDDHVRWPLAELARWITEGVKAICLAKPSAYSASRLMSLVRGTLQTVPQTEDAPKPLILLGVIRNITAAGPPRVGGRIVKVVSRDVLDAEQPYWHDATRVPFRKEVRNFVFDEKVPLEFYTYPGNDGSGVVEIVTGNIPAPLAATGSEDDIASWAVDIGLPEPYQVPLTDYVVSRALSKDALNGDPALAQAYYQKFANTIGIKVQVEGAHSPRSRS